MTQFSELGLADPILRALEDAGYDQPTPIQAQAIPHLLAGRDLMGIAQTGTGKTAAFVLPVLHRLAEFNQRPKPKSCRALILSPTRELSAQIRENLQTYSRHMRLSSALVVGGLKIGPQIKVVGRGVDVIVATPGRLLDLVKSRALTLEDVQTLVLDEADQMLDLGFFPAIRQIVGMLPATRQTAMLSATMPKQIKALAHDLLTDPAQISVAAVSRPIERIEQSVILTPQASKRELLLEILSEKSVDRAIVFARTKRGADRVNKHLDQFGLKSAAIHGDKTQGQRVKALEGFKAGKVNILVATDIAARGIDVDDVSHVVNFDLPNIPESYVHRIGRTARAGKAGIAVSLCDPSEFGYLMDIERTTGIEIDKSVLGEEKEFFELVRNATPAGSKKKKRNARRSGDGEGFQARKRMRGERPEGDAYRSPKPRRDRDDNAQSRRERAEGSRPRRERAHDDQPREARSGDERPRQDRGWKDRSQADRAQPDRSHSDRPRSDRSKSDRPKSDRPHKSRPRQDRPEGMREDGKPWRERQDKPAQGDRPGKPRGEKTWKDKPRGEKPQGDRPYGDKPRGDKPRSDRPRSDNARFDETRGDKPRSDKQRSSKPRGGKWTDKYKSDKPKGGSSGSYEQRDGQTGDHKRSAKPRRPDNARRHNAA